MNEFLNQTDLGKLFGGTSHDVGKWLKHVGLRAADGRPTAMAKEGGFTKQVSTNRCDGQDYTVWHVEKTIQALEEAGYRRLVEAPTINADYRNGPFSFGSKDRLTYQIRNSAGQVVCVLSDEHLAEQTTKLLNLALKFGRL